MPPQPSPADAIKGKIVIIGEYSVGKTCLSHRFINRSYTGRMEPTIGAAFQVRTLPVSTTAAMQSVPITNAIISQLTAGPSSDNGAAGGAAPGTSASHSAGGGGSSSAISGPTALVKLELWDTAGSERYRSLMPMYFRDASAAVICFDIGNNASFERVGLWLTDFRKHNEGAGGGESVEAILCGTKCDLSAEKREVSADEARAFAEQHGMAYFETSAKRDINVQELFFTAAHSIYRARQRARATAGAGSGGAGGAGGSSVGMSGSRGTAGGKVDLSGEEKKSSKGCC